jgi:hypothetical protein
VRVLANFIRMVGGKPEKGIDGESIR